MSGLDPHGTRGRYIGGPRHKHPCRCERCCAANTEYMRLWRKLGSKEQQHDDAVDTLLELLHGPDGL